MRKLLIVIAALLIFVALAGPAVTGRLVEGAVAGDDNLIDAGLPVWLEAVSHRYRRGWFNASSELRLVVTDRQRTAMLSGILDPGQFGDEPGIVVASTVSHGPVVDLATPALAQIDSRLFTENVTGQRVMLPLTARTTIGLTGGARTDWTLAEGGTLRLRGGPPLTWTGAGGSYEATAGGRAESASIRIETIEIGDAAALQRFGNVTLGYAVARKDGTASLAADFAFDVDESAQTPVNRVAGSVGVDDLPGEVLRNIAPLLRDVAAMGAANVVAIADRHESLIRQALADPLALRWRQMAGTEFGDIRVEFDVTLPDSNSIGTAPGGQALVDGIMAETIIAGRIELPVAFADAIGATDQGLREQLTMLRGTGVLAPDPTGELLVMVVDYSGGALTVNGAPLPVPATPTSP